jgi:hypothetical protein
MSQIIMHQWEDGLTSFDHRRQYTGILMPGRYCGFDTFSNSGLGFTLAHSSGGYLETDIAGSLAVAKKGVHITRQGLFVHETASITGLTCATNAANASIRTDLVIVEHLTPNGTPGGSPAVYSVVQGPNGSSAPSSLPNPEKQVILGRISIPASASDLNSATYTPEPIPFLGGADLVANFGLNSLFARLAAVNVFTKTQIYGEVNIASADFSGGKLTFKDGGNSQYYAAGNPAQTFKEIQAPAAGSVHTRFLLRNISGNSLTIQLSQSPTNGGLPIYSTNLGTTSIVIPTGEWVELAYASSVWWILNTSVFTSYLIASKTITDQAAAVFSSYSVVTGVITPEAGSVSTASGTITYKKVGKLLFLNGGMTMDNSTAINYFDLDLEGAVPGLVPSNFSVGGQAQGNTQYIDASGNRITVEPLVGTKKIRIIKSGSAATTLIAVLGMTIFLD